MLNSSNSSPTISNITFSNNYGTYGGGMYNGDNSSPALAHVSFFDNSGYRGAGNGQLYFQQPNHHRRAVFWQFGDERGRRDAKQ